MPTNILPTRPAGRIGLARLDTLGASASLLCAIHCAVLPFVLTLLPVLGLSFLVGETVEWILVGLAVGLAALSLLLGFRRHRSLRVLALLSGAVVLLVAGRWVELTEGTGSGAWLMVAGGLTLVTAHGINYVLCRRCRRCEEGCAAS
jgi:hypothetical protein